MPQGKPLHRRRKTSELVLAAYAIAAITALYLLVVLRLGIPAASGFFGHTLGVLGFLLMLATETLYSVRKRALGRRWGRMSEWLRFHIFTGLVGPYMVFLHAAWSFKGLAGLTFLLTGIVVLSGFVGRYIYTAVPRTADGVVLEAHQIRRQLAAADAQLQHYLRSRGSAAPSWEPSIQRAASTAVLGRVLLDAGFSVRNWLHQRRMDAYTREKSAEIQALVTRRRQLQRQIASLATARRMLAVWHSVHIPLGMTLFVTAFIHAFAAVYYATLLR